MELGTSYMDPNAGIFGAIAVINALIHRKRTSQGQYIDQSQLETAVQLIVEGLLHYQITGREPERVGNHHPIMSPHNTDLPDRTTGDRPYPNDLQSSWLNNSDFSYYHALEISLRKRFSHGVTFDFHYTWGKAMTNSLGNYALNVNGYSGAFQNYYNSHADYGPAGGEIRKAIVEGLRMQNIVVVPPRQVLMIEPGTRRAPA